MVASCSHPATTCRATEQTHQMLQAQLALQSNIHAILFQPAMSHHILLGVRYQQIQRKTHFLIFRNRIALPCTRIYLASTDNRVTLHHTPACLRLA